MFPNAQESANSTACRTSCPGLWQSEETIARAGRLLTRSGRLPSLSPDAGARRFLNGGEPTTVPFHSAAALADEILMVLLRPKEDEAVTDRIMVDVVQAILAGAA